MAHMLGQFRKNREKRRRGRKEKARNNDMIERMNPCGGSHNTKLMVMGVLVSSLLLSSILLQREMEDVFATQKIKNSGDWNTMGVACGIERSGGGSGGSGDPDMWAYTRINSTDAKNFVIDSRERDIDVAVLDTGVDDSHPDLNVKWKYDAVEEDGNGRENETADDDVGHGTNCAGIIAGLNNDLEDLGVVSHVDLYCIKVGWDEHDDGVGDFYSDDVRVGMKRATRGPNNVRGDADDPEVMSMSFGFADVEVGDPVYDDLYAGVLSARNNGIALIASAGNDGDHDASTDEVWYPANFLEVIAVGATDRDNKLAYFEDVDRYSCDGSQVELAAPGIDVYTTSRGGGYGYMDGTSPACALVAGTVALIRARDLAVDGAFHLGYGTYDSQKDYMIRGILHITAIGLGEDNFFGYGLVDAYRAVLEVESYGELS